MTAQIDEQSTSSRDSRLHAWIAPGLFLGLTLILWLPFGFNITCYADGLGILAAVDEGRTITFNNSRPFTYLTVWLGYFLDPNSFTGLNIVFAATVFFTGLLVYLILRQLNVSRVVAITVGALSIVYPVDAAYLWLGAINIHGAVVCYLFAVYLLLVFVRTQRWPLVPLMIASLAISAGTYEACLPLILVTPAILLVCQLSWKRRIIISALWYVVPVVTIIYLFSLYHQNAATLGYQSGLLQPDLSLQKLVSDIIHLYGYALITGWNTYYGLGYISVTGFTIPAGLITLAGLWWLSRQGDSPQNGKAKWQVPLLLGVVGLAVIGLGFATYLPTALSRSAFRTMYFSSIGGALCVTVCIWLISRMLPFKRIAFVILAALLISNGIFVLLKQHLTFVLYANKEITVVQKIVAQVPSINSGSTVLLIDASSTKALQSVFPSSFYLKAMLNLLYHDYSLQAGICYPNITVPWSNGFADNCTLNGDDARVEESRLPFLKSDYSHLLVLNYADDGSVTVQANIENFIEPPTQSQVAQAAYHPENLIDTRQNPPGRARTLFQIIPVAEK